MDEKKKQQPKINLPEVIDLHIQYQLRTRGCRVNGPLNLKPICLLALAEAIKAVTTHTPPVIQPALIQPNGKPHEHSLGSTNGNGGPQN